MDEPEYGLGKEQRRYGDEHRDGHIQDQSPGNNGFHLLLIFRPEGPGKKNAVTAVDAVGKTDDQTGDGARKTDGGESRLPEIVAGDHGIADVVTLLEKVTDKKWDGEDQDVGQGTSLRHIPGLPLFGRTHVVKTPISFVGMHIVCQHTP